jgi:hypothetical protein
LLPAVTVAKHGLILLSFPFLLCIFLRFSLVLSRFLFFIAIAYSSPSLEHLNFLLPRVSSQEEEVVIFLSKSKKDLILIILSLLIFFIASFCVCVCVCESEREKLSSAQLSSAQLRSNKS